ncbi:MAG TPA: type II secretion system F family protein [Nitrososphaerales archaeon]|nr:type II secretion system F family protein [Nitrososphaerales archaeon]
MPLSRWQKFRITLKIRYRFRRDIFTLGVPVVIAIVFSVYAFHSGFASFQNPNASGAQSAANAVRQAQVEALQGNISAITHPPAAAASSTAPEEQNLYLVVSAGPAVAFMPYIIDTSIESRRRSHYEQDFADFLFELSELVRGGIDPAKAFLTLAQGEVGSITTFVKTAAKQMNIGFTFEQALQSMGRSIGSPLAGRYIDLVIQASYAGGSVSNLIQNAAIDMGNFLTIEKEKKSGLSQYTVVLYMGQIVLIVLSAILVVQFIPQLVEITKVGSAGLGNFLGTADIANVTIERNLFFLVFLNGLFGGLVIGKISEGKVKAGLKHSIILIIIALLVWDIYVLPATEGAGQNLKITVLSYDNTGLAGFPQKDPIVINITDTHGNPVPSAAVSFIVTGGGIANPPSATTDATGQSLTKITLGNAPGPYVVLITSGNAQVTLVINATNVA